MRISTTDCNNCPECVRCGRNFYYCFHACDRCESTKQLYKFEDEELCASCLLSEFEEVDMEE